MSGTVQSYVNKMYCWAIAEVGTLLSSRLSKTQYSKTSASTVVSKTLR